MEVYIRSQEENFYNQRIRRFHCGNLRLRKNEEGLFIISTRIDNEEWKLAIYDTGEKANYAMYLIKNFIKYNDDGVDHVFTMPNNKDVIYKYGIQRYKDEIKEISEKPIKLTRFEYELLKYFSCKCQVVGKDKDKTIYFVDILMGKHYILMLDDLGEELLNFLNSNELMIWTILDNCEIKEVET